MATRKALAPQEFYHLYNRGTDKRKIFDTRKDYERFQGLLYLSNSTNPVHISNHQGLTLMEWLKMERGECLVDIVSYCLMPNHFHLLVRQREDGGISTFMQKLTTGYTMYYNRKNERTGTLFQGTYKSQHAHDDRYLKYLFSYIHLNPIKLIEPKWKELGLRQHAKALNYLKTFPYSSYLDYVTDNRSESVILNKEAQMYFESPKVFTEEIFEWLSYGSDEQLAIKV